MPTTPTEPQLNVHDWAEPDDDARAAIDAEDGAVPVGATVDDDAETLRDAFVEAFNARDLDELLALLADDVDCADAPGDGPEVAAGEFERVWERAPAVLLTRAFLEDRPCAVAWLPAEEGGWQRTSLVLLDVEDGLITAVSLPDDVDALEAASTEIPDGELVEEWADWAEWDRGEESGIR